jgi:hypothetical protein
MKRSLKKRRKRVELPGIPTEEDWGNCGSDLDQNHAHSVFAGHTNEEMQPFFRRNPLALTDDLRWMPDVPFRYYILGFRDFVTSKDLDFLDASDAASCFLSLVLEKLENNPGLIVPVMPELLPAVEYVARNQSLFNADENIYGNFLERLSRIQTLFAPYGHLN